MFRMSIKFFFFSGACPINTFNCLNGRCIANLLRCDGEDNCGDGTDEDTELCRFSNKRLNLGLYDYLMSFQNLTLL